MKERIGEKMNMKNRSKKVMKHLTTAVSIASIFAVCLSPMGVYAAEQGYEQTGMVSQPGGFSGSFGGFDRNMADFGGAQNNVTLADEPSEIALSTVQNTAIDLIADEANATTYVISNENNDIKIDAAGTYIVTGECSDGNITVKKGTTDVVLILRDLDLTSTTGATVSLNKNSEVKLIIEGTVNLMDAEDPADEDSEDAEVADAFDGAAIKAKDGSNVYLTGTGTLNIDAASCKNGIKVGDADTPSFVIEGSLEININAANDALNSGYDLTILSGTIVISAGDDAIHADRILTIGSSDGTGPTITIDTCEEGLEGTVVNLFGGNTTLRASDDGVNAANSDGTYSEELDFSINITGGRWTVNAAGDGLDSNGNINVTGGYISVTSGSTGGEAGIDFDGVCYISDNATLINNSGISGPDGGGAVPGGDGAFGPGSGFERERNFDQGTEPYKDPYDNSGENEDNKEDNNEESDLTMYRLYNPNNGEHFYTRSTVERDNLTKAGWSYEGEGFTVPEESTTPVYRLYDPINGDHHYTTSLSEKNSLVSAGWNYEGISWYSAEEKTGKPVYRLYNPNAVSGRHHFTISENERNKLVSLGWIYEGVGFYAE